MLPLGEPKFRRRKADRPAEIVAAALQVFADKGFAAARLDDIAAKAGVSKGAIYLYFETKEDIFRAVVEQAIAPDIEMVAAVIAGHPGPFSDLLRAAIGRIGDLLETSPAGGVAKMVIGEAKTPTRSAVTYHLPSLEAAGWVEMGPNRRGLALTTRGEKALKRVKVTT